jgi:hypothetical protein
MTTHMNGSAEVAHKAVRPKRARKKAELPTEAKPLPATYFGFTIKQLLGYALGGLGTLIAAGWISVALPAKQSDLNGVISEMRSGFSMLENKIGSISTKMDNLQAKMEVMRLDLTRVQTIQSFEVTPAPAAPSRPVKRARPPEPKADVKANSLFGSGFGF